MRMPFDSYSRGTRKSLLVSCFLILPGATSSFKGRDCDHGSKFRTVAPSATSALSLGSSIAASKMAVPPRTIQTPRSGSRL